MRPTVRDRLSKLSCCANRDTLDKLASDHQQVHRDLLATKSLIQQASSLDAPAPSRQDVRNAQFDRMDLNNDGVIDRAEFMQMANQPDAVPPVLESTLPRRLEKLALYWDVVAAEYLPRGGSNRTDSLTLGDLDQAAAELESLSRPYGFGKDGATYAQEIPGEEVFRDVVRMKVARIQNHLKHLL